MNKTLIVTELCNMHCSFCCFEGTYKPIKDRMKVYTQSHLESFLSSLSPNDKVSLMGGEPLLFPKETEYAIKQTKEIYPNMPISVYTNASLLTPHMVNVMNEYDINMVFSINLYGEKGLVNLIKRARKDINIINLINAVRHKCIRTIYPRMTDFSVDVFGLHNIFKCDVELSTDNTQMQYWTNDDIDHLDKELKILKALSPELKWFNFTLAHTNLCLCDNHYDIFLGTSPSHTPEFYASRSMYGCCGLRDAMGDKLYNRYCVVINNHLNN